MASRLDHGRIAWTCDCGVELYGDFLGNSDSIEQLKRILEKKPCLPSAKLGIKEYIGICVDHSLLTELSPFSSTLGKQLIEIETSSIESDGQLFCLLKDKLNNWHTKVVSIQNKHVIMFKPGIVDLYEDTASYPSLPWPPIPENVFLHYMNHPETEKVHTSRHWLDRLPKKRGRTFAEDFISAPDELRGNGGWGIYVKREFGLL